MAAEQLIFAEPVQLDAERMAALYTELGEDEAEAAMVDAMEQVAICLSRIDRERAAGDLPAIADTSAELSGAAACVGLAGLAAVSADVSYCASRGDLAALGAVLARLSRVGDRSLAAIWNPGDIGS